MFYNPVNGDPLTYKITLKPRHCFIMTRLGNPIPEEVKKIQKSIKENCQLRGYASIDATSKISGKDFLNKIWELIAASPLCIAICHDEIPSETLFNIYYEIGLAQAMGKETLIVKSKKFKIPSDFVRTEYIEYDRNFNKGMKKYFDGLCERAEHYKFMAEQTENNPILALDYIRRAFLILGDETLREQAITLINDHDLNETRSICSVERLLASF